MGVTGLLPCLAEIQEKGSLERYRGKTLAIDTFGWIHRGLISCAQELCLGQPTRKYITSIMNKVQMLRHFGVEPYFVFDGSSLPTKAATNAERRKHREEARAKADALIKQGNRKLAWKEFMKAACVTSQMVKSLIIEFDNHGIKYVIAPYEADPQMVYLEKAGLCDGILSEDSDLLIFGCTRLITKLKDDGSCVEINRNNFAKVKKIPNLAWYSHEHLRLVAMLSGCDYTKGINGVGIQTAFKLVRKYHTYEKVMLALQADSKTIPAEFNDEYIKANLAFQFQKVFDPKCQQVRPLNEYPSDFDTDLEMLELCCGNSFTNELWQKICNGHIDPNSHETLVSREQSLQLLGNSSVYIGRNSMKVESKVSSVSRVQEVKQLKTVFDFFATSRTKVTKEVSTSDSVSVSTLSISSEKTSILSCSTTSSSTSSVFSTTTHESIGIKRSNPVKLSPTSKKLQRISDGKNASSSYSNFFSKGTNLKQVSLPADIARRASFGDDSDFTDECSSPIKQRKTSTTVLESLTDNDEDGILSDEESQPASNAEVLVAEKIEVSNEPECPDTSNIDDEIEESPVKGSNGSIADSKLFNFCQTLRNNFLFDAEAAKQRKPLAPVNKNIINTKSRDIEKHEKMEKVKKMEKQVEKTEPTPVKLVPIRTKLTDFAFAG